MELLAVIVALETITQKNIPVAIYTDSQYVVNSVERKWLDKWMRTGFAGGKKNKYLWLRYAKIAKDFHIKFHWVKGHASNVLNNRCDQLATAAADSNHLMEDTGYVPETL
jgi:ribonuclease HI